jgi:hypothetical protein
MPNEQAETQAHLFKIILICFVENSMKFRLTQGMMTDISGSHLMCDTE